MWHGLLAIAIPPMDKIDVEAKITAHYIDDTTSWPIKLLRKGGVLQIGRFIKANQSGFNSNRNKWIISIGNMEVMVDGNDIDSFPPSKRA